MEFIVAMFQALAWPVALLVVALLFRTKLIELLSSDVKRLRAGPVELEWERQLVETRVQLDYPQVRQTKPMQHPGEMFTAPHSPEERVVMAYDHIRESLRAKLEGLEDPHDLLMSPPGLARTAAKHGLVPNEIVRAVEGLAILYELARNGRDGHGIGAEKAAEYEALASAVVFAIGPDDSAPKPAPSS
ncbi:hypothetical protein GCM10009534_02920 [Kribbella sandramycini]